MHELSPTLDLSQHRRSPLQRAFGHAIALVVPLGGWAVAALFVHALHGHLPRFGLLVATVAAIVIAAGAAAHALPADEQHCFHRGLLWFALTICTELVVSAHLHHAWLVLLGGPAAGDGERAIVLTLWFFAPMMFPKLRD